MSEKQIIGEIKFPNALLCSKSLMGQTIEISIKGIICAITFPSFPDLKSNHILLPYIFKPTNFKKLTSETWGLVYSNSSAWVFRALLIFFIPNDQANEKCKMIYKEFENWIELFDKYFRLLSTQHSWNINLNENMYEHKLTLYSHDYIEIENNKPCILKCIVHNDDKKYLNLDKLKEICELASTGQPPRLEYTLLFEAYNSKRYADYRKTIIEAASALELCLTKRIMKEFKDTNIMYGEKLLKRYKTLRGRFDLMKDIGIALPTTDYQSLIIAPRNNVVHRSVFPSVADANSVIFEVEKYLNVFSPTLNEDTII